MLIYASKEYIKGGLPVDLKHLKTYLSADSNAGQVCSGL